MLAAVEIHVYRKVGATEHWICVLPVILILQSTDSADTVQPMV